MSEKQVQEGDKAPKFTLKDKDGEVFGIGAPGRGFTVVYFYPKDNTPGCTVEAQEFSALLREFSARNVQVIGISGGDEKTKAKFCAKYSLSVPLVSDGDFKVSSAYGVYGQKKFMGRTFEGIHRRTFLVDANGIVVRVFTTVKPSGHAQEVLDAIDELQALKPKVGPKR
jgi:peroxiredoxin Q/BCP